MVGAAMRVETEYISVGCNRIVNAMDWGHCGFIAYAAHHMIAIYDVEAARLRATLRASGVVNCVKWVPPPPADRTEPMAEGDGQHFLLSGDADGNLLLWCFDANLPVNAAEAWKVVFELKGHRGPVAGVALLWTREEAAGQLRMQLVSTAGDDEVRVWRTSPCGAAGLRADTRWELLQTLEVGQRMQDCAALAALPHDTGWTVLALGGVDAVVRLLTRPPGGLYEDVCRLQGHENWIRSLAFTLDASLPGGATRLLLASASQDRYARIWTVSLDAIAVCGGDAEPQGGEGGGGLRAPAVEADPAPFQAILRYAPQPCISAGRHTYKVVLEALLIGHDDWVHEVAWQPRSSCEAPCLLTSSMDRTMMLWRPDRSAGGGVWMPEESLGDAGSSSLGYFGGSWSPDGLAVAAHGFTGGLHMWRRELPDPALPGSQGAALARSPMAPVRAAGGHFRGVVDLCWGGPCSSSLLSASQDQTVRVTARFGGSWCEVARPQVHGHDFACLAAIPACGRPSEATRYASGSDEKVIRVFDAPTAFLDTLALAQGRRAHSATPPTAAAPLGAALPALGLSNKAVFEGEQGDNGGVTSGMPGGDYTEGPDMVPCAAPGAVKEPPLEEHLAQNTLWPESRKLYGHGNDVFALAASPDGHLLASASKAQSASFASIWLWDTQEWKAVAELSGHQLTVTQLQFSPDGAWLLSCSRDRSFCLYRRQPADGTGLFELAARVPKAHDRIIWGVSWSEGQRLFATASRDRKVKIWAPPEPSTSNSCARAAFSMPPFSSSATAVAFGPVLLPAGAAAAATRLETHLLALGFESGNMEIWGVSLCPGCPGDAPDVTAARLWTCPAVLGHAGAVRRLSWMPRPPSDMLEDAPGEVLASCAEDHSVRIYRVELGR